jgi:hypothetical protein
VSSKSTEVTKYSEAELAVMEAQASEMTSSDLHVPILKIGQSMTREVKKGDAQAGEFVNTLTGEGCGNSIGLIVSFYTKGRAGSDGPGEHYFTSNNFEIIPDHWGDWLGEEWVGQRFSEHPEAEEEFKARVNRKEIPWGRGPKISTTHNYTGYAIVPGLEGEDDEFSPVRLSLKRTDMEAVRRINSMFQMKMRNQPYWSRVLDLSTEEKTGRGSEFFGLAVKLGRETTPEEREMALDLAMAIQQGRVTDNADKAEAADSSAPEAKGALAV